MNNILSITVACLFLSLFSCDKGQRILKNNIEEIEEYLDDNNLTAQRTEDDLFYIIEEEGNGVDFPTLANTVEVDYHGYFLNGDVFDSSVDRGNPSVFALTNVIRGWREGIPLFSEGGKGKLILPSHMGYGEFGNGSIPGETVLVFDINLIDIK